MPHCKTLEEARGPFDFRFRMTPVELTPYLQGLLSLRTRCREEAIRIYWLERYPTKHTNVPNISMLVKFLWDVIWDQEQALFSVNVHVTHCEVDC
jgi:hypothetical protein